LPVEYILAKSLAQAPYVPPISMWMRSLSGGTNLPAWACGWVVRSPLEYPF